MATPAEQAQQRILRLMATTNLPLVMREREGRRTYSVGDQTVSPRMASALIPGLDGGGMEIEAFGHVQVRRYTLPKESIAR